MLESKGKMIESKIAQKVMEISAFRKLVYLLIVILTALLSASKARRSDIISAVAPPSF